MTFNKILRIAEQPARADTSATLYELLTSWLSPAFDDAIKLDAVPADAGDRSWHAGTSVSSETLGA